MIFICKLALRIYRFNKIPVIWIHNCNVPDKHKLRATIRASKPNAQTTRLIPNFTDPVVTGNQLFRDFPKR